MTVNQISYQQLQEAKRANSVNERIAQQNADSAELKARAEAFRSGYSLFDTLGDTVGGVLTGWGLAQAPAKSTIGKVASSAITKLVPGVGTLFSGAVGTTIGMDLFEKFSDLVNASTTHRLIVDTPNGPQPIKFKTIYNPETDRWLYKFDNGAVINEVDLKRLYGLDPLPGAVPLGVNLKKMWEQFVSTNMSAPKLPNTIFN